MLRSPLSTPLRAALALGVTLALLVALEGVARFVPLTPPSQYLILVHSHARDIPLLTPDAGRPDRWRINPLMQERFADESVPIEKDVDERRVLCLGGSTVRGVGAEASQSFPRQLEKLLAAASSTRRRVLNFGANGFTSTQLRWVADELRAAKPDVVVIYSGHNEWTGARLYGSFADHPRLTQGRALLSHSRLYLLMRSGILRLRGRPDRVAFAPGGPPATETENRAVAKRFERNLRNIRHTFESEGARVVFCTVISNPFTPPAGSPVGDSNPAVHREAHLADLLPVLDAAALSPPLADYREAVRSFTNGRRAAAYELFVRARDADSAPLRATTLTNEAIRHAAEIIPLVDLDAALRERFLAGEPVGELFADSVHFTAAGAEWAAQRVAETLREN
ncbi:MAG: SGNH/GDSL hydrolase family protein [Candidatus Lernaella stagnicola]|nr:SGNH/GDSL hydrolase family protein [Candidatus Lernaella stagnicola]